MTSDNVAPSDHGDKIGLPSSRMPTARPLTLNRNGGAHPIPEHPGQVMPSPSGLKAAYDAALAELEHSRGKALRQQGYAGEMQQKAFDAFLAALSNSCASIVVDGNPEGKWARSNPPPTIPQMHVVASGPGSGKTTLAKAFAVALVRASSGAPFPLGCALLVHQVETADKAFRELSALLPGQVAVWTREHDADRPVGGAGGRTHRFTVDELQRHPIIIVTHEFYKGVRGAKARTYKQNGMTLPRVITFIDEKVNEIETYDVTLSGVADVCRFIQKDDHGQDALAFASETLLKFIIGKHHGPFSLETPSHDPDGWKAANSLRWFTTESAGLYMRSCSAKDAAPFDAVFGFGRSVAEGRAFIIRRDGGARGSNFVGYERALPQVPGMVLLDATADIDGVSELCPWRKHAPIPNARYNRLEVVHVPSVAQGTLSRWLRQEPNRWKYVRHILDVVTRHVQPGQRALLVCKKQIVDAAGIPDWSQHVDCFVKKSTTDFAWDLKGRRLAVTWWGGYGIGANDWREAEVVLLFDDFHLPGHTLIATAQGLKGHTSTEGVLATLNHPNDTHADVEALRNGQILRWLKQMALRGQAREFDDDGACSQQKLVVTGDLIRLIENFDDAFLGAKLTFEVGLEPHADDGLTKLVRALMTPNLPDLVSTKEVGRLMDVEWRKVSGDLTRNSSWSSVLAGPRWRYVPKPGRPKAGDVGSHFLRITIPEDARPESTQSENTLDEAPKVEATEL